MKRLYFIWILLLGLGCFNQSKAFWQSRDSNYNDIVSSPYTYAGAIFTTNCASPCTIGSVNIGSASSNRYVVLGIIGTGTITYATSIAGTILNVDVFTDPANNAAIFSGLVTAGSGVQPIIITCSAGCTFNNRDVYVWYINKLNTNSVKNKAIGTSTDTINVTSGDFMFAVANSTAVNYSGSTQAPAASHTQDVSSAADWTISNTNAAFSVVPGGAGVSVAATYH